jgi:cyclopropane fatty-acyl-phospholipid synthase-like methyltransferase
MYRSIFVDLELVIDQLAALTPDGAHVLDIGGGDGAPINGLASRRPDVTVTMIDPGESVGGWIEDRFTNRVSRLPHTPLAQYLAAAASLPDIVFLLDVIHHVPVTERPDFFAELGRYLDHKPGARVLIKDVQPGPLRATMGLWSDRYITGDRNVSLVGRCELKNSLATHLGPISCRETGLYELDAPNYMLEIQRIVR